VDTAACHEFKSLLHGAGLQKELQQLAQVLLYQPFATDPMRTR
jgi:hypothetical protein